VPIRRQHLTQELIVRERACTSIAP
jgi:hypothetical protein